MPAILIPSSHKHVELWASNVELSRRMLNCSLGDLCVMLHLELLRRMLNRLFADRICHIGYWIVLCMVNCHLACCITNLNVRVVISNFVKWNVALSTQMVKCH